MVGSGVGVVGYWDAVGYVGKRVVGKDGVKVGKSVGAEGSSVGYKVGN